MTEFGGGMKRPALEVEGEEDATPDAPAKKFRHEGASSDRRVELRALIPSKNAGAIIGKGGSNISRLRSEFKASVTVPDCPGPERVLTIASDVETVCDVLSDIIPKLEDLSSHASYVSEVRMLVHQSHAGCIIGRAGFKIKELREETGASIKVYTRCCPQSTERVVQISGKPTVVVGCIRQIFAITEHSPTKGPIDPYDPHNADAFFADDYGGFVDPMNMSGGGRSGPPMGKLGMPGPPPMRGEFGMGDHGMGRMGRGGGRGGFMGGPGRDMGQRNSGGGMRMGRSHGGSNPMNRMSPGRGPGPGPHGMGGGPNQNFRNGNMNSGGFPRPPRMPKPNIRPDDWRFSSDDMGDTALGNRSLGPQTDFGGGSVGGERMMGTGPYNNGRNETDFSGDNFSPVNRAGGRSGPGGSTQVTIPKELAGSIIGRGGSRIRQIRQDSGANITIDEALPGCSDRVITITGSPSQIQMAQYLLQQSVREHSGRRF